MGGKGKIGKELSSKIHDICEEKGLEDPIYFEPFIGMCGVMRHIKYTNKIACDKNEDIINMWRSTQKGWIPPRFLSREQVFTLKNEKSSDLRGFASFGCSYGGMPFGTYIGEYNKGDIEIDRSSRSIERVSSLVKEVDFLDSRSYDEFVPTNMVVYCDPPYITACSGVRKMKTFEGFDHDVFWENMRKWSMNDNIVLVSEFTAPDDFKTVWTRRAIKNVSHSTYVEEKLFMFN